MWLLLDTLTYVRKNNTPGIIILKSVHCTLLLFIAYYRYRWTHKAVLLSHTEDLFHLSLGYFSKLFINI